MRCETRTGAAYAAVKPSRASSATQSEPCAHGPFCVRCVEELACQPFPNCMCDALIEKWNPLDPEITVPQPSPTPQMNCDDDSGVDDASSSSVAVTAKDCSPRFQASRRASKDSKAREVMVIQDALISALLENETAELRAQIQALREAAKSEKRPDMAALVQEAQSLREKLQSMQPGLSSKNEEVSQGGLWQPSASTPRTYAGIASSSDTSDMEEQVVHRSFSTSSVRKLSLHKMKSTSSKDGFSSSISTACTPRRGNSMQVPGSTAASRSGSCGIASTDSRSRDGDAVREAGGRAHSRPSRQSVKGSARPPRQRPGPGLPSGAWAPSASCPGLAGMGSSLTRVLPPAPPQLSSRSATSNAIHASSADSATPVRGRSLSPRPGTFTPRGCSVTAQPTAQGQKMYRASSTGPIPGPVPEPATCRQLFSPDRSALHAPIAVAGGSSAIPSQPVCRRRSSHGSLCGGSSVSAAATPRAGQGVCITSPTETTPRQRGLTRQGASTPVHAMPRRSSGHQVCISVPTQNPKPQAHVESPAQGPGCNATQPASMNAGSVSMPATVPTLVPQTAQTHALPRGVPVKTDLTRTITGVASTGSVRSTQLVGGAGLIRCPDMNLTQTLSNADASDLASAYWAFNLADERHRQLMGKPSIEALRSKACCLALAVDEDVRRCTGRQPGKALAPADLNALPRAPVPPVAPEMPPSLFSCSSLRDVVEARLDLALEALWLAQQAQSSAEWMVSDPNLRAVRELRPEQFVLLLREAGCDSRRRPEGPVVIARPVGYASTGALAYIGVM